MPGLKANGVELFYERAGEGEPVVCTHGAWSNGHAWDSVTEMLVKSFEIIVWDRRGHSRSQDGTVPGSTREDARDLAALIEALATGPVHAIGNSAGGNVVLNLVTLEPDLVKTAAVHEPGPFGLMGESGDPRYVELTKREELHTDEVIRRIASGEPRRAAEYFVDQVAIGPGGWQQLPDVLKSTMEANASTVPDDIRDGFDIHSVDIEALKTSSVPLLISAGSESPELERGAAQELARLVPAARLETLTGAGHIPHRTHPVEYSAMLADFMVGASVAG